MEPVKIKTQTSPRKQDLHLFSFKNKFSLPIQLVVKNLALLPVAAVSYHAPGS